MTLGESIKSIRIKLRLSQRELAEAIQCSQTAISSFELGTKKPSYDVLKKISEYAKENKIKISLL